MKKISLIKDPKIFGLFISRNVYKYSSWKHWLSFAQIISVKHASGFLSHWWHSMSLQIGHRESNDLDFFNQKDFQPEELQRKLEKLGNLENVELRRGTMNCFLDGVKLQFLHYPYPLLEEKLTWENIKISSKPDIACTKLITVSA